MPLRRLADGISRRPLWSAACLVVPICLAGAGRWFAWEQLERVDPAVEAPPPRSAPGTDVVAASIATLIPSSTAPATTSPEHAAQAALMREAMEHVDRAQTRYAALSGYACLFTKRERLAPGRELMIQVMEMKVATAPLSIYFHYKEPSAGREALWIDGRNDGKVLVREGGLGRLLAGTLKVDPRSRMAMSENRHPINEAGFGFLLSRLAERWPEEMAPTLSRVAIERDAVHDGRPAVVIECLHPDYDPAYLYHKVRVTLDTETGLPVRFQAFGWPEGGEAELLEDYAYTQLRLDPGLATRDLDPSSPEYPFNRF